MRSIAMQNTGSKTILSGLNERKLAFSLTFLAIFFVTFGVLSVIGAVPEISVEDSSPVVSSDSNITEILAEEPVRVVAASVNLDDKIANPASADIASLDRALLKSSVRYPGSALLGEEGNVLLFGHSSYLRTTLNPAYKAFNDIQKLKTGETITVYSETMAYEYRVSSVKFVKVDDGVIDLTKNGTRRLTLVTCNSFADKSDRFVVEAEFVGSYPLGR